jgi:DNA invertase Pin-like site-specific DNA recombinase
VTAAIYARVSTDEQSYAMQLTDLRRYAKQRGWSVMEYVEKESSVKKRPVFLGMLEDAKARKVDVILVWRIDRFARSMKDFVLITLQLADWKVRLISTTENVDTGDENPFAEFQRGLLALLAQLERKIIVARVNAGIAQAQREGKHCGRPKRIFSRPDAVKFQKQGLGVREIAKRMGVHHSTIVRALHVVQKGTRK